MARNILPISTLERHAGAALPDGGMATSTVLPIVEAGALRVTAFWFKCVLVPKRPLVFYPPHRLLVLDPRTGDILRAKNVTPGEVGPDFPPDQPLPKVDHAWGYRWDAAKPMFARRDEIAPAVWLAFAGASPVTPDVKSKALELQHLFRELEQPPLFPYYERVGAAYFDWVSGL